MMFMKTILALSFASLALAAPTPQLELGPDEDQLVNVAANVFANVLSNVE
ncbi:hypothetical protein BGW80DRAFT_1560027 [Lactifluus volemus]|nr:hypothetical protein BGW80DRAFT_1560027 [Lactifluus volemus]